MSNFYLPYCGAHFEPEDPKRIMKIMLNSAFVEVLRSSGGRRRVDYRGGGENVVLPVEVVSEKGEVFLGYFVETLILK